MATALHHPRTDSVPNPHLGAYPRPVSIPELDFSDTRFQPLVPQSQPNRHTSAVVYSPPAPWDTAQSQQQPIIRNDQPSQPVPDQEKIDSQQPEPFEIDPSPDNQQQQQQQPAPFDSGTSAGAPHALPPGAAQGVMGRYSFDDTMALVPFSTTEAKRPPVLVLDAHTQIRQDSPRLPSPPARSSNTSMGQDTPQLTASPDPRYRSKAVQARSPSAGTSSTSPTFSPAVVPLLVTSSYNQPMGIPISPNPRAYAQQPVYVTPPSAPKPVNPVYTPARPGPPEEVCVECAMRDRDMAEVDVTSPGVWDRDSDVWYEELLQREREERESGFVMADPSRPRATGGRLTETNLKIWLSVNPREPASRQQTLEKYIRSQRKLLEAEVIAHARAMQEARQLDNKMKDTYSQLRRSAYDYGNSPNQADELGGVRIKSPLSPSTPAAGPHARGHSRDVTLLENGLIVEHVDVRKEEKEARERRRREEKRARKSSRSSGVDVTSLYSNQSLSAPLTDGGVGLRPHTLYSISASTRPTSVLTNPTERPHVPRAYSQASFSDVRSLSSLSPRRSKFFGMKNLSAGWRSQDSLAPSGISGSMIDMHVALQREAAHHPRPIGATSLRQSQIWPTKQLQVIQQEPEEVPKKRQSGFKKIWRIVTGSSKADSSASNNRDIPRVHSHPEDDFPLAPPPPLSFLVDRSPVELSAARQGSTPSVNSISPKNGLSSPGMSPPTAPSSVLPSPASSGRLGGDRDVMIEDRNIYGGIDNRENADPRIDETWKPPSVRAVYPNVLDSEMRPRVLSSPSLLSNRSLPRASMPPSIIDREKSLPPLPDEVIMPSPGRPVTVFDAGRPPADDFSPPMNGFRSPETRRQSFAGMMLRTNNLTPNQRSSTGLPKTIGYDTSRSLTPKYDEFAFSRRSLGRLEHVEEHPTPRSPTPSAKRKSKFGLSSLFGKKNNSTPESAQERGSQGLSTLRLSDSYDSVLVNGASGGPTIRQVMSSRMSVASRKAIEELVEQDPEFVAYRYPSNDQRLDLLR